MDDFTVNSPLPLFEGEGQLSEADILFLEETSGIAFDRSIAGEVDIPLRMKSYFSIGDPIANPLAQLLTEQGEAVPADIRLQMQDFEFWQIQLACSFQPASGCRFSDARFALSLQTLSSDTNVIAQTNLGKAIAYDLFPLKFEDECKVSIKKSFNPEIKFNFDPISSSLTLPLYERSEEYVSYTSRVVAFDLQGTQPAWSFTRTASHEIDGPQKLFMIVRKPKGMQVKATFSLTARVQFLIGKIALDPTPLVILFRRRGPQKEIDDTSVILC